VSSLVLVVLAPCAPFASPGGGDAAPPQDASAADAATSDAQALDGPAEPPGADANPGACAIDAVIAGSKDTAPLTDSTVPATTIDGYGYYGGGIAVISATCVRIYLAAITNAPMVRIGVYSNGASGPDDRRARATLMSPVVGWNVAPLDKPVSIGPGTAIWIGVVPSAGSIAIKVASNCSGPTSRRTNPAADGSLPDPFGGTGAPNAECGAAMYLSQ
jgi:hypothetical protein